MMVEQHYDEEVLAAFLTEPADAVARDRHLSGCSLCRRTLDSLRATTEVLHERAVWEDDPLAAAPRPETIAFLRTLQSTMKAENALADTYVKALLAGTRETWAAKLAAHPEWRTPATVRKLIEATDRYNFSSPLDAVEVTRLATDIVESLPSDPLRERDRLAADAWREHAYALLVTGQYDAAEHAALRAETSAAVTSSEYANARATLMSALLLRAREQWTDAAQLARAAAGELRRHGDAARYCSARLIEAIALYDGGRYAEAARVYEDLRPLYSDMASQSVALAIHNEALCHRELRDFATAEKLFVDAIGRAEALQMDGLRAKTRWHFARVLMRQSRFAEAKQLLSSVRSDLEELGMAHDVADVSLDIVECLIALGQPSDIAALCRSSIAYFENARLAASTSAMTALAYLQEAAAANRISRSELTHVRMMILEDRKKSTLQPLFAPARD